jgi:hypothetical protein
MLQTDCNLNSGYEEMIMSYRDNPPSDGLLILCETHIKRSLSNMGYRGEAISEYASKKLENLRSKNQGQVSLMLLKELPPSAFHRDI